MLDSKPLTITKLLEQIKYSLESHFKNIHIEGEITNLSFSQSGHYYFSLSDKDSMLSACLFKMDALRNPVIQKLKDGVKVLVSGDINVYQKRGSFQIVVKKIIPLGLGDLKEQFEKLKLKLKSEGLFDIDHKKPIPKMPKRVAIITAEKGAALQDFLNIYRRRSLWMDIILVPALVQGQDAPKSIRKALHQILLFDRDAPLGKKIDVIVLARGGGSLEDLWAFNDEGLAYDIFNSPLPIISAIGHEVDYSISDFVADLRAETPSAAAEILTHHQTLIKDLMVASRRRMLLLGDRIFSRAKIKLESMNPKIQINKIWLNYNKFNERLNRCDLSYRVNDLTKIHESYLELDYLWNKLKIKLNDQMTASHNDLKNLNNLLNAMNPTGVLERGYTYVEIDKNIVSRQSEWDSVTSGVVDLHFFDGVVQFDLKTVKMKNDE